MMYEFSPISADDVDAIVSWRYDPPYDFYDMDSDPEDLALFTNPTNWDGYYAVFDGDGERVGFFSFEVDADTLEIGLGMRPDLTGDGHGQSFVEAGLMFAREEYDPAAFSLSVAAFNERAISVYEAVGFERVETFLQATNGGEYPFVRMRYVVE
ncbi:GNAT family protein [Haladaptatus sp. T7]|uniref:GNAT family N-acetyltransferase n=1 Tax=Haladaptatus sp. T7 TaxID=2029368 RepID=UPI0021A251E8|nr:GNAT family protein [Haladaptatus sp. T7]GKZ14781.1 N-acetyltransferase [Haladaptatus sp. T7]